MKLDKKIKAREIRKQGRSINEISKELGVSKSSVSLWVRDVKLSKQAKAKIRSKQTLGQINAVESHRRKTYIKLNKAKMLAKEVVRDCDFNRNTMRVLCCMLYWCEGSKSLIDSSFIFTNSDQVLVGTYLKLFRKCFSINEKKFRVVIHLHDYHDEAKQLHYWSRVTNIPLVQFQKSYKKANTKIRIREGYQGCASIRYNDVALSRYVQAIARCFMSRYGRVANW